MEHIERALDENGRATMLEGAQLEAFPPSVGVMLEDRAKLFGTKPVICEKRKGKYQAMTWGEFCRKVTIIGAQLIAAGIKKGDRLAILSENRSEMLLSELAAMSIGALSVPIFAGYFPPQIEYIIKHSAAKRLTVSTASQLMKLSKCQDLSNLEAVVLIDHNRAEFEVDSICGIEVIPFSELLEEPSSDQFGNYVERCHSIKGDDPCLVMYTSGTTGDPKGVELRHSNLLSQQQAIQQLWDVGAEDRFLSYLPWHHSFGGLFERFMALYSGASIAIDESGGKDIQLLISNWREVRPTVFFSVPNVYQKLCEEMKGSAKLRSELLHSGLRFVFTAAAPLPQDVSDFFTNAAIPVHEGWGLTETSPCVTLTDAKQKRVPGVVGFPIPGVKVKLGEDKEILVSGPNVMRGYYNAQAENAAAFTADGWFRTGDLGEITENGLRILGRRDGVFKLLNAEKVFAAQIELALVGGSEFIEQALVVGSGENYVTALIYPNHKAVSSWAKENGIVLSENGGFEKHSDVRRLFSAEVQRINNEVAGRYQRVRKFVIIEQPLSLEAGELTPTAKVVRNKVILNNKDMVDALYKPACPPASKAIICLGDCY